MSDKEDVSNVLTERLARFISSGGFREFVLSLGAEERVCDWVESALADEFCEFARRCDCGEQSSRIANQLRLLARLCGSTKNVEKLNMTARMIEGGEPAAQSFNHSFDQVPRDTYEDLEDHDHFRSASDPRD